MYSDALMWGHFTTTESSGRLIGPISTEKEAWIVRVLQLGGLKDADVNPGPPTWRHVLSTDQHKPTFLRDTRDVSCRFD